MFILRLLCRWFPALRFLFIGVGYIMLLIGVFLWFVCFPLTAYTLYYFNMFPLEYFGIPFGFSLPLDVLLPKEIQQALVPLFLSFTLFGMVSIYFNVRNLRRLRRGENPKQG